LVEILTLAEVCAFVVIYNENKCKKCCFLTINTKDFTRFITVKAAGSITLVNSKNHFVSFSPPLGHGCNRSHRPNRSYDHARCATSTSCVAVEKRRNCIIRRFSASNSDHCSTHVQKGNVILIFLHFSNNHADLQSDLFILNMFHLSLITYFAAVMLIQGTVFMCQTSFFANISSSCEPTVVTTFHQRSS